MFAATVAGQIIHPTRRLAPTTPHDLRRTFVSELIDLSDLATAKRLAGHARADQTAAYDRRHDRTRRRAAAMLTVPLRGRSRGAG
jgi:integrase